MFDTIKLASLLNVEGAKELRDELRYLTARDLQVRNQQVFGKFKKSHQKWRCNKRN
jgi:hypothetical protein